MAALTTARLRFGKLEAALEGTVSEETKPMPCRLSSKAIAIGPRRRAPAGRGVRARISLCDARAELARRIRKSQSLRCGDNKVSTARVSQKPGLGQSSPYKSASDVISPRGTPTTTARRLIRILGVPSQHRGGLFGRASKPRQWPSWTRSRHATRRARHCAACLPTAPTSRAAAPITSCRSLPTRRCA